MNRLLALALLLLAVPVAAQEFAVSFAPDRIVVRLAEPLPVASADAVAAGEVRWADGALAALAAESGVARVRALFPAVAVGGDARRAARARDLRAAHGLDAIYVLDLAEGADVEALVRRWSAAPGVVFAEPDFLGAGAGQRAPAASLTDDPFFNRQWGLDNTGTNPVPLALTPGADVNAPEAWTVTTGSADIIVAVLDSGLRLTHPDIAARVWTNEGEVPGNGVDDDGNGYIDDHRGWDFVTGDNDPTDEHGHGTNVAGLVGAIADNGIGYSGTDQAARIMVVRGLDAQNLGFYTWWAAGLEYAANNGADVVNMSMGGNSFSAALQAAVDYAHGLGVFVAACMMNTNNAAPYYPAAFANTVAVGATDGQDQRVAPFCWGGGSNFGPHIDVVAPGDYMYGLSYDSDTNYGSAWCGTSQATPLVAAGAALMLAVNPSLGPEDLRAILRTTAADGVGRPTEDTPGFDVHHGYGRLDLAAALSAVPTANEPSGPVSEALDLSIFPNPFRGRTVLTFTLDAPRPVRVDVLDGQGRVVRTLHEGVLPAGAQRLGLDAEALASGVYLVRVAGEGFLASRVLVHTR